MGGRSTVPSVPRVVLQQVRYTEEVERHIREDHPPLIASKVRQALVYSSSAEASWEEDPQYGHQVVAFGTTLDGDTFKAYLHPVNPNDPDEGSFDLKTAFLVSKMTQQE
jgi:hypothetical protein